MEGDPDETDIQSLNGKSREEIQKVVIFNFPIYFAND